MSRVSAKATLDGYTKPSDLADVPIPDYEGMPVTDTKAKITKTGDGLSESMAMASIHVPSESRVCILVYAVAKSHRHDRIVEGTGKDKFVIDEFLETVTLEAEGALLIDPDLVANLIIEHQKRVDEARAEAAAKARADKGELPLPFGTGDDDPVDSSDEPDSDEGE